MHVCLYVLHKYLLVLIKRRLHQLQLLKGPGLTQAGDLEDELRLESVEPHLVRQELSVQGGGAQHVALGVHAVAPQAVAHRHLLVRELLLQHLA